MRNSLKTLVGAALVAFVLSLSVAAQVNNAGSFDTWTTKSFSRSHGPARESSYIKTVRAAKNRSFDRVVFEFQGPMPNYRIDYLKSRIYENEDGRHRIRLPGNVFVQLNFFVIPFDDTQEKYTDAKNFVPKGNLAMRSLMSVKDETIFEGYYDFLVGVRAKVPFRVTELSNPSRLVIDFKH